jgi:fructose-bisphosphate aldolase class I
MGFATGAAISLVSILLLPPWSYLVFYAGIGRTADPLDQVLRVHRHGLQPAIEQHEGRHVEHDAGVGTQVGPSTPGQRLPHQGIGNRSELLRESPWNGRRQDLSSKGLRRNTTMPARVAGASGRVTGRVGGRRYDRYGSPRPPYPVAERTSTHRGVRKMHPWLSHSTTGTAMNRQQHEKIKSAKGFIAALDQSGGSTPKALSLYGIGPDAYSGDQQMFDLIHAMRTRIITSPAFNGDRILGSILFEQTMDREIEGHGSADYLWSVRQVVPFLKIDKGLADEANGAQMMKAMPNLDALLARAKGKGIFGTKMRSVVKHADAKGIEDVVTQQFTIGKQILATGLMPILEPEVDIHATDKQGAERLLKAAILKHLDTLGPQQQVMLKLTIPSVDDFYADLVKHPKVLRVVALSGGYSRDDANMLLARNHGVIASFSRALTEGLTAQQSDQEFNRALDASIASIYQVSGT